MSSTSPRTEAGQRPQLVAEPGGAQSILTRRLSRSEARAGSAGDSSEYEGAYLDASSSGAEAVTTTTSRSSPSRFRTGISSRDRDYLSQLRGESESNRGLSLSTGLAPADTGFVFDEQPTGHMPLSEGGGAAAPVLRAPQPGRLQWLKTSVRASKLLAKLQPPMFTLVSLLGYGLSFFINSITGSLVGDQTPSQSIFLLSLGRGLMLCFILPILALADARKRKKEGRGKLTDAGGDAANLKLDWQLLVPAYVSFVGNIAFLAYYALVSGGEVSVLAPMVGLYAIIPVLVGLFWRGEAKTWPKLVGIALSFAAVLVLAFSGKGTFSSASGSGGTGSSSSSSSSSSSAGAIAFKVAMFLLVVSIWGSDDVLSSAVKLDPTTTALSSLFGQLLCCVVFGFTAFIEANNEAYQLSQQLRSVTSGSSPVSTDQQQVPRRAPFGLPHLAVIGANCLAILAWLAFVRLGQISQVSAFVPVISLYTYVPVILSLALMGEAVTTPKVVGEFLFHDYCQ